MNHVVCWALHCVVFVLHMPFLLVNYAACLDISSDWFCNSYNFFSSFFVVKIYLILF